MFFKAARKINRTNSNLSATISLGKIFNPLQKTHRIANFVARKGRVLSLTFLSTLFLHHKFQSGQSTKFLAPTPTNSSVERIFSRIKLTSFDSLVELFQQGDVQNEKVLILINPKFFNDNFLGELSQSIQELQEVTPSIKIVIVNEDELSPEQRGHFLAILQGKKDLSSISPLSSLPANFLKQTTLFFTKNAYDDAFEELGFSTFFNNKEYITDYFEPLRVLTAANENRLFEFASTRMSPEQLYFVAVLPSETSDSQNGLSDAQKRRALKRLNDLKINSFLKDGIKYGVVHTELTELSFGKFNPGDVFMVQVNSKTKDTKSSPVQVIGETGNILVSKVIDQQLVSSDNWSLARGLKSIGEAIFKTNLYFPNEILQHKDLNYLVKITFDKNQITPKQLTKMREKMKALRAEMNRQFPKLAERTVFSLNPGKTKHEGWRLIVNDVKRSDMATM